MTTYLSHAGAAEIVSQLREFWRAYPSATFHVELTKTPHGEYLHAVRSNLVGGLPPGAKPADLGAPR